jgi:hypothetical protein
MEQKLSRAFFVFGDLGFGLVQLEKFLKLGAEPIRRSPAILTSDVVRLPSGLMVAAQGQARIKGEVIWLEALPSAWAFLEEWHGVNRADAAAGLCELVSTTALVGADGAVGTPTACELFRLLEARIPVSARRVEDGDWQASHLGRPPLCQSLTPRQREYIRKLSLCSGRDVVPIDLNLYRELLRLEVAVDKGRRLALTSLGHELNRWLP